MAVPSPGLDIQAQRPVATIAALICATRQWAAEPTLASSFGSRRVKRFQVREAEYRPRRATVHGLWLTEALERPVEQQR